MRLGRSLVRPIAAGAAALAIVAALAVVASSETDSDATKPQASATPEQVLGAAALTVERPVKWSQVRSVDRMRPVPAEASADRPDLYDQEPSCQVASSVDVARVCEWGDTASKRSVVIVGDSKVVQWQPALDAIGKAEGWKLVQITKSGCAFTDAMRVRDSRAWTECRAWGRRALSTIVGLEPDLVLTSHRAPTAVPDDWPKSSGQSRDLMVDGLESYWSRIANAGIPVAALLDNPAPPVRSVADCVAVNTADLRQCAFDRNQGIARSGAMAQLAASIALPEVGVLDMTDVLCPDSGVCPPVIGGVVVYRDGSHLTATYVRSAAPQLADRLAVLTDGAFGAG